ncbi:MAG: hypothetical protein NTX17_10115 [Candidatus Eisenbacteria bacterium]|nr:hypothetical protein [Candidatus Eisenbacteria bacterium]
MTRFLCVVILVLAVAAPAFAFVPDPGNTTVSWVNPLSSTCFWVCPDGDASGLEVYVNDQNNQPLQNVVVTVAIANPLVVVLNTAALVATTDVNGYASFTLYAGTDANDANAALSTQVTVTGSYASVNYEFYDATMYCVSPDLDGASTVGPLDYSVFQLDWLKSMAVPPGYRSDYNRDGTVNALDYSKFQLHYGHTYP